MTAGGIVAGSFWRSCASGSVGQVAEVVGGAPAWVRLVCMEVGPDERHEPFERVDTVEAIAGRLVVTEWTTAPLVIAAPDLLATFHRVDWSPA